MHMMSKYVPQLLRSAKKISSGFIEITLDSYP